MTLLEESWMCDFAREECRLVLLNDFHVGDKGTGLMNLPERDRVS